MPSRVRCLMSTPNGVLDGKRVRVLLSIFFRMAGVEEPNVPFIERLKLGAKYLPEKYRIFCFRVPRFVKISETEYYKKLIELRYPKIEPAPAAANGIGGPAAAPARPVPNPFRVDVAAIPPVQRPAQQPVVWDFDPVDDEGM